MSNIASKFLEAMGIVADKAVSGVAADETIYAQIVSIDTEQTNTYKLAYENAFIEAVGLGDYKVGDIVSVKIPNGDFQQRKTIIEKWTGVTTKQDFIAYEEEYKDRADLGVSDTSLKIEGDDTVPLSFVNAASALSTINQYRAFQLSGLFDYRFAPEVDGVLQFSDTLLDLDYGVELVCKDKEGNEHTYTLGINDFAGNPYSSYGSNISQTRLFALADGVELAEIATFRAFVNGSSSLEENQSSYFNMTNFAVTVMGNLPVIPDYGTYVLNLSRTADTVLVDQEQILVNVATEARVLKGTSRVALNTNNLKCIHGTDNIDLQFSEDGYVATLQLTEYPETWGDIEYFEFAFYHDGEIVSKATLAVTRLENGTSPYTIVLSNDFDTVPAKADGSLPDGALSGASTTAMVFYGDQQITTALKPESDEDTTYLSIEVPSGETSTIEWNEESSEVTVTLTSWKNLDVDSQDFRLIYYVNNSPVAIKTFSIARVKMGLNGDNAIDYSLKCTPDIINKTTIGDSCNIEVIGYYHDGYSTIPMTLVESENDLTFNETEPVCYITYHWGDQVKTVVTDGIIAYEKSKHKAETVLTVEMTVAFLDVDGNEVHLLWETEEIQLLEDNSEYYSLALDNDADVWVRKNTGDCSIISDLPTITATVFKASLEITDYSGLSIDINTNSTIKTGWYTLNNNQLSFDKTEIPKDLKWAQFTFKWTQNNGVVSKQTFSVKVIEATYDYDLYIDKTVVNNTTTGGEIEVQVWKKGDGPASILDTKEKIDAEGLTLSGVSEKDGRYIVAYEAGINQSDITIVLQGTVGTDASFEWDREVIEFVHDGQGIQTVYAYALVNEGEVIPNKPDGALDSTDVGWSTVLPEMEVAGQKIYVTSSTVIDNSYGEWSAPVIFAVYSKDGVQGAAGTSPYMIELSNDTVIIGAEADGTIDTGVLEEISKITVTVWQGDDDITDHCTFSWSIPDGLELGTDESANPIYFTNLTVDTAVTTATVKKDDKVLAAKNVTVSKNKQGQQGVPGEEGAAAVTYKLSITPNSWNATGNIGVEPIFTVIKYSGASKPEEISEGYTIISDSGDWGVEGDSIYDTTIFDLYINEIKVDSETVTAVWDGEQGQSGSDGYNNAVITLYQRAAEKPTNKPAGVRYYFSNNSFSPVTSLEDYGWYITIRDDSLSPCYSIQAQVSSQNSSVWIDSEDWSDPVLFVQNGIDGTVSNAQISEGIQTALAGEGLFFIPEYDDNGEPIVNDEGIPQGNWYANISNAVVEEALMVGGSNLDNCTLYVGEATYTNSTGEEVTGLLAQLGGWRASAEALYSTAIDDKNKPYSYLSGGASLSATIGETKVSNLIFKAGTSFGVTQTGILYADSAVISGELTAGSNSKIGDWQVIGSDLFSYYGVAREDNSGVWDYYRIGLKASAIGSDSDYVITVQSYENDGGDLSNFTSLFHVTGKGSVYANNLEFAGGTITGNIGIKGNLGVSTVTNGYVTTTNITGSQIETERMDASLQVFGSLYDSDLKNLSSANITGGIIMDITNPSDAERAAVHLGFSGVKLFTLVAGEWQIKTITWSQFFNPTASLTTWNGSYTDLT